MHDLDDREKQLRDLTASQDRSRRLVTTERNHTARALHHMQQQLQHERTLKRTAFHQVDDLLEQVRDYCAGVKCWEIKEDRLLCQIKKSGSR